MSKGDNEMVRSTRKEIRKAIAATLRHEGVVELHHGDREMNETKHRRRIASDLRSWGVVELHHGD